MSEPFRSGKTESKTNGRSMAAGSGEGAVPRRDRPRREIPSASHETGAENEQYNTGGISRGKHGEGTFPLWNLDLYAGSSHHAVCLAALGGFLFYADGNGGAEHCSSASQESAMPELAGGNDSFDHSESDGHDDCSIHQREERPLPQPLGKKNPVHSCQYAVPLCQSGADRVPQ